MAEACAPCGQMLSFDFSHEAGGKQELVTRFLSRHPDVLHVVCFALVGCSTCDRLRPDFISTWCRTPRQGCRSVRGVRSADRSDTMLQHLKVLLRRFSM